MKLALSQLQPSYDAVVVGAGCAGGATAMLLARQGLSVLALERGAHGHDTLSTHALMRGAVVQLHRWRVLDAVRAAGTPPIPTTTFHYGDDALEFAIEDRGGVDALYAPRRTLLDRLLADEAARAGAHVVHRVRMVDLVQTGGRVGGVVIQDDAQRDRTIGAGIVIGADGRSSAVARTVGAAPYAIGRHATSVVYGYWADLHITGYHWYYRNGVSAGVIPTNGGVVCVFASAPAARFATELRFDYEASYYRILTETAPQLARAVRSARRVGGWRPFAGRPGFLRQSWGPGWALVGDAGYFKDPLTAHGITDALRDAELLARAVDEGTDRALARYQAERDELSRGLFAVTDAIASFEWDFATLQKYHRALSQEMKHEVKRIQEFDVAAHACAT